MNWQLARVLRVLRVLQDNLIRPTFMGDAVAGGSVQLALVCVTKMYLEIRENAEPPEVQSTV